MAKLEIDQSGKVEQTAKDTILCVCNHTWYAVRIPAHLHAKEVATGKQKPTTIITTEVLLKIIKKTEVGKRLKDA